ncbi:MAG: ABC transporter ATP-binding protein [Chitinophagales bacterium]
MAGICLTGMNKVYPNGFHAVKDVDLDIGDHEFVVLLGPSGCGKTTILRMIAGLERITSGQLFIGEKLMNLVEAKDRDVAMVFQNFALYPHMTVFENLAFALKIRKMTKSAITDKVHNVAKTLDMEQLLPMKPRQLSGGQMQRVALGRAMVREPSVFLMDEPLSNLDMQLRVHMRAELTKLHERLQTTFVYVTHDQMEAMTMGSLIVVMNEGVIQQIGTPMEVYERPKNMFVAGFIGSPSINFIEGKLNIDQHNLYIDFVNHRLNIPKNRLGNKLYEYVGNSVILGIRPEDISCFISPEDLEDNYFNAEVERIEPIGHESYLHFTLDHFPMVARIDRSMALGPGGTIRVGLDMSRLHIFDPNSQEAL